VIGSSSLEDTGTHILFECEVVQAAGAANPINGFIDYLRAFNSRIDVQQVSDYLPAMRAYEAKDPEMAPAYATLNDEQKRAYRDNVQRYIDAPSPGEAIRTWLQTEGPGGASAIARDRQIGRELGLRGNERPAGEAV
jgi:hypothetical protein